MAWHKKDTSWEEDKWELYHTDVDFNQTDDLATRDLDKLKELIAPGLVL